MACRSEADADRAASAGVRVEAGLGQPKPALADRKILIWRVYRRAMACSSEADADHACFENA